MLDIEVCYPNMPKELIRFAMRGFGQRTNCGWVHSPPGMAAAYEPTPKGALALHLTGPLGKGRCDTVV